MEHPRIKTEFFVPVRVVLASIVLSLAVPPPGKAAEVPYTERVISAVGASSAYATDVDGDGDIDVLSASGSKFAWFESDGGSPPGFTERVLSNTAVGARSVYATDVDGDGDVDVVAAAEGTFFQTVEGEVTWYENDGGSPPSFTERVISSPNPSCERFYWSVHAADVDGDGDMDVLAGFVHCSGGSTNWYENDGGSPPSFTERSVPSSGGSSVFATDVDGDGDTDVVTGSRGGFLDEVTWDENNGGSPPSFTDRVLSDFGLVGSVSSVFAADVDGDGDIDVLAASQDYGIRWYENDGGSPPSFTERTVPSTGVWPSSVFATDMDGDGDTDVLAAFNFGAGSIAWYENRLLECGNGLVESGEECDDGDIEPGDGCSETCMVEPGSKCTGEPSVCITGIPAVSTWGLAVMGLTILCAGTIVQIRRTAQGKVLLSLIGVLCLSSVSWGMPLYVDASCGDDAKAGTSPNCADADGPKLTLQNAIGVAAATDEIIVAQGTYNELIDFSGKAITLRSTNPTDPAVVAATIIDGSGLGGSVVTCASNEGPDTLLSGFTITGGIAEGGAECITAAAAQRSPTAPSAETPRFSLKGSA